MKGPFRLMLALQAALAQGVLWSTSLSSSVMAMTQMTEIFVAPNGKDSNPGTRESPLATPAAAQKAVRRLIVAGLKAPVTVMFRGGTYRLEAPLAFGPEDSPGGQFSVAYVAAPGEKVVFCGGRPIAPWKPAQGGLWTAMASGVKEGKWYFRSLFVNGRRATRARSPNRDAPEPCWQLKSAALSKDLKQYTLSLAPGLVAAWRNLSDVEVVVAGNWEINRKRLASVDEKSGVVLLAPPHAQGHEAIRPGPDRWCHFENALEMLDQPGEWYLDRTTGLLTYWPLPGEDMSTAEVIAPALSCLLEVTGAADRPVRNVHFQGIQFQHTDWPLPAIGYMGIQACHHVSQEHWSKPWSVIPGAIRWQHVEDSSIEDGSVCHLGGSGIQLGPKCRGNLIQGMHLFDVAGNGIMIGGPNDPAQAPVGNRASNNHVHACGVEYYGAVGIWVGFARDTIVSHNLVHDLPYTGISVGWQWNPSPTACKQNRVEYNHIYNVMNRLCDGGGIYTLGFQPGTVIRGNHIHEVHRSRYAQGAPNNGMFIDEGSKGFLFEDNVIYSTAAEYVRFNQCKHEWHTWRNNHFGEPAAVKEAGKATIAKAGPEPAYRRRLGIEK